MDIVTTEISNNPSKQGKHLKEQCAAYDVSNSKQSALGIKYQTVILAESIRWCYILYITHVKSQTGMSLWEAET